MKRTLEKTILLTTFVALLAGVLPSLAVTGRMRGTVVDDDGNPVEGVKVTVTCAEIPRFREVQTTSKKGLFSVSFSQPHHVYTYQFGKEGYQSFEQEIGGTGTETMRQTFVLNRAVVAEVEQVSEAPMVGTNPAITAFNEGITALKASDLETAKTRLETAILEDPELAPAYSAVAGVYLDLKSFEQAVAAADKALALRPGDREALQVSYEAYRALGRETEAKAASEALQAAEDSAATARRIYNEGGTAYQAGDLETALAKFQEAATLDSSLYDAHHAVASLLAKEGKYSEAVVAAEQALALEPEDTRTLQIAYQAYRGSGDSAKATETLVKLSALDPQFGATNLLEQGAQLFNAGSAEEAKVLLETALSIDPELAKAHYLLGLYYINQGNNAAAKDHLSKFLEMAPEDDPDLGSAREMLGFLK